MGWTFYNKLMDEEKKTPDQIEAMANTKPSDFPDYYLYELTRAGMSVKAIASKINATPEEVAKRLDRYEEQAAIFNPLKEKIDAQMKLEQQNSLKNIG